MRRNEKEEITGTYEEIEKLLKVVTHTEEYRQAYEEMINGKDMDDETIIE